MPTDKNVPPLDSFESDQKALMGETRVDMRGDSHLTRVFNPVRGEDRVSSEQYDTHTWAPGGSGERRSGRRISGSPVPGESAARVPSKLA